MLKKRYAGPTLVMLLMMICGCSTAGNLGKTAKASTASRGTNATMMSLAPARIRLGAGDGIGAAMFSQYAQARIGKADQVLAKR